MTYTLTTLDNGLRVASEPMPGTHTAAIAIAVKVGARYEVIGGNQNEGGLSHLLEHMAFKGTTKMNAKQIAEAFDMMGGHVNAYTSHEHTVYHAKVLKEYANEAAALLCDIVANSIFDEAELTREREVILQEIAMHQDSPDDVVFDLFQETAFTGPLSRSILGTPERVSSFSRDDVVAYIQKHYRPDRMSIAGAGAIDHAELCRIATAHFGTWKPSDGSIAADFCPYQGGEKTMEKDLEQVQLVIGFPGLPVGHDDYYALQLFATILGGGMSSRLFQEIRENRGLAYSVSAFASGYQDAGTLAVYAGTTVEHLAELTGALTDVFTKSSGNITEVELRRAKNQLKSGIVMSRESCSAIAEWIARHLLIYGRYRTAEEILAKIDAVTVADVARIGAQILRNGKQTIAALGPIGSVNNAQLTAKLAIAA